MKHPALLLAVLAAPLSAHAWDPASVLNYAVQSQVNRQLRDGVAQVFRSIERPSTETLPDAAGQRDARPGEVVLYGTPNCGYCVRARQHLRSRNIPFLDKDVDDDREAHAEWQALGGRGVPVIVLGRHKLTGFSAAHFDRLYAQYQAEQAGAAPAPAASPAPAEAAPAAPPGAYAAGDVLTARIARVRLLAAARADARSVGQLAKNEEVVYLGEASGAYLKVRGAEAEGWADRALLARP